MTQTVKRIPYGIANYRVLQQDNMYYVDKTRFIPQIEAAPYYLIFIRPRRFGKSLWLSVLQHYYDVNYREQFAELFGNTWIGQNPTPDRNTYLTLAFNFSAVNPHIEEVQVSFEAHGDQVLGYFLERYQAYFGQLERERILSAPTTADRLQELFFQVTKKDLKLYLLIDEYDNFANTILTTAGESAYRDLTHGAGFFRYFFNLLKSATTGALSGLTRLFITGVSPITLDDVTSGFNIGTHISLAPQFNELLGFTEAEIHALLTYYQTQGQLTPDMAEMEQFTTWYGGYRFAQQANTHVFNPDAVLYFLEYMMREGQAPPDLIDQNLRTDYKKLRHLLTVDRQLNGNFSLLREIIAHGETRGRIKVSFSVERLLAHENFISLLYYLGLLTFDGEREGLPVLQIPNLTVRELLYGYLRDGFEDVDIFRLNTRRFGEQMGAMAYRGHWQPVFDYLAEAIAAQTSVRDYLAGEKVIQGFLLAYLNVTNFFLTWSERELGGGFVDIYLEPFLARYPDMRYGYLIELKYIPREKLTETRLAEVVAEAEAQLRKYRGDARAVAVAEKVTLKCLVLVYHGWELVYREEWTDE